MDPLFFATPAAFRRWLASNHAKAKELWVGFHKKDSGEPSITWPESVDEALCFGWIDGIRKSIDAKSYKIRFTPRRRDSPWSNVNTKRAGELIDEGRMKPAGRKAFEARQEKRSGVYSFEQKDSPRLTAAQAKRFRADRKAWGFFSSQPAGYRRLTIWWIVSAKREETREKRLSTLIADSAAGLRIAQLRRP